jgi:hypothetical protein
MRAPQVSRIVNSFHPEPDDDAVVARGAEVAAASGLPAARTSGNVAASGLPENR